MRGVAPMDINSWKSSLVAKGIEICLTFGETQILQKKRLFLMSPDTMSPQDEHTCMRYASEL